MVGWWGRKKVAFYATLWEVHLACYVFKKSEWPFSKKPARILMTQHFSNLNMECFLFSPQKEPALPLTDTGALSLT